MFKAFVLGFLAAIVAGGIAAYFVVHDGLIPANADGQPLPLESWAANAALDAALTRGAPKEPNPVPLTDANLIAGIGLYGRYCAICHGTAKGDASMTPLARGLYTRPPQLASHGVEDDPEGYTFWKIKHGIRWTAMPSWAATLSDNQIWMLALFLKHMNDLSPAAQQAWQQITD